MNMRDPIYDQALYLSNARVVLPHMTLEDGAVVIRHGVIESIAPSSMPSDAREINLAGGLLMPGMIDLHCDALEKEVEPRPGVHFPLRLACAQADRRNAAAGITTVYHSLSFANHELGVRNNTIAAEIVRAMHDWQPHALVDNRMHLRYEVTDTTAPPILADLMTAGFAQMISFMDHSPGQGQFKDVDAFRSYLSRNYKTSDDEIERIIEAKKESSIGTMSRIKELIVIAKQCGIAIASHDDDTVEKLDLVAQLGVTISEFPINLETAKAARARGVSTLFGAPNILRGKSQSGSMRALDAVINDVADCLCGDYSPAALLPSTLRLIELADIDLHQAVALVTKNPARAAGLMDRGEIRIGQRADLISVRTIGGVPQAEKVWVAGVPALHHYFDHQK
jgi:alpha-D-ribose 1-methylphosphonate 5-triphosphate diphosphatase